VHVGRLRERGLLIAGERDDLRALALQVRREQRELVGLAGVRKHHDDVVGVIIPRSPCEASAGWTKNAGVPVDASVAASLRAIWPDLPMPETTTRPRLPEDQLDGGDERVAEPARKARDRVGFGRENAAGE
jgi:hypothetical protein